MNIITRSWIPSTREIFGPADQSGAAVAHARIIRAALHYNIADHIVLVRDTRHSTSDRAPLNTTGANAESAHDLIDEFGARRVSCISPEATSHYIGDGSRSVILASGPDMAHWITVRTHIGLTDVPICGLLHSAKWDLCFSAYTHTFVFCHAYDALVATSIAGQRAAMMARKYVEEHTNSHDSKATKNTLDIPLIPLGGLEYHESRIPKELAREQLGLDRTRTLILYFGRLSKTSKADLEPLLVAVRRLVDQKPLVQLVIAGSDHNSGYKEEVLALVDAYTLGRNVALLGAVAPKDKIAVFSAADIMVSPVDNIQETFGLSIAEAMGCGVPVVISSWSGYRDLITDGREGFLVPTACDGPGAKGIPDYGILMPYIGAEAAVAASTLVDVEVLTRRLGQLVDSPELRSEMGKRGMERAQRHYSSAALSKRLDALWTKQLRQRDIWAATNKASKPLFSHYEIFRTYPDVWLSDDQLITTADDAQRIQEAITTHYRDRGEASFVVVAQAVIESCGERAVDIATLCARIPGCRSVVLRLLKIGALVRIEI